MEKLSKKAEVTIAASTNGSYFIRIEDEHGIKEITLTSDAFAKAVSSGYARGPSSTFQCSITGGK